jgi:hypothetical protein
MPTAMLQSRKYASPRMPTASKGPPSYDSASSSANDAPARVAHASHTGTIRARRNHMPDAAKKRTAGRLLSVRKASSA